MDPITKAIQKVREERHSVGLTLHKRALVPAEISYTQTRNVSLYPGWLRQNRIIASSGADEFAQSYKVLRTQVAQRMRQHGWRTLAVTSPGPGEGKTLTAINLSISLALEANQTVLLVDADLRRPSVHAYLGFEANVGLRDYLQKGTPVEEILVHPEIRRLVILPGGAPLENSSEMLSSPMMLRLVQEVKRRYPSRLVVFDLPPVLTTDDVLAFAPYLDAALLVIEEGKTLRDDVARAAELLHTANHNLIGTVLNRSAS
ncbi:MAG: CpsD/CapB family tyrosine-protein kinase [Gammaproteobacteria bacterium]|nr:CpsD/CapB family tyrosine-protein kinase [Gammaproteobacteria bacterium]